IRDRLGMQIVPIHPRGEDTLGATGYRSLADAPAPVDVVDCFVNSTRAGDVVDEAIAQRERLGISAVWLQLGVIDEAAAERAKAAGLDGVMDTCPALEAPRLGVCTALAAVAAPLTGRRPTAPPVSTAPRTRPSTSPPAPDCAPPAWWPNCRRRRHEAD